MPDLATWMGRPGTDASEKPSRLGLSSENQLRLRADLSTTFIALLFLLIAGLAMTAVQIGKNATTALVWALACMTSGFVGGFLFAIPRVPRTSAQVKPRTEEPLASGASIVLPPAGSVGERGYGLGINTNLEEISDWLTKILVGLGLIELRSFPDYLQRAGYYVGQSFGENMHSAASGLIVYFLGLGFLSGYLLTRLFIGPIFRLADEATSIGLADQKARASAAAARVSAAEAQAEAQAARQETHAEKKGGEDYRDLADILDAVFGEFVTAQNRQKSDPGYKLPAEVAQRYITELTKFQSDPRWSLQRRLHIVLARLYKIIGDLGRAIDLLTAFIDRKREVGENDIHLADALFNRACYRALQAAQGPPAQADEKNGLALQDLEQSIKLSSGNASAAVDDSDFALLRENPKFKALVEAV